MEELKSLIKAETLKILTIQCSEVYASSRTSSSKSLLPISAFRTLSYPGGLPDIIKVIYRYNYFTF